MRCEHYVSHRIFLLSCRVWNCDLKWCGLYMGIDSLKPLYILRKEGAILFDNDFVIG